MRAILRDLQFSLRQMRKSPGFLIVAVLTLALGIGANVAVFSVMNAVLLNPRGVPHPQGLVVPRVNYLQLGLKNISVSAPDFADLAASDLVRSAAAMQPGNYNLSGSGAVPERLIAADITWQWFNVFEAKPLLGRVFRAEEDLPNANHEVVLSYGTWKRRFGGDPSIVGRNIQLNQQPYQVVGVMDRDFGWPNEAEIWVPLGLDPGIFHDNQGHRFNENLFAVARLKDGATAAQADAWMKMKAQQEIAREGAKSFGQSARWGMFAMPMTEYAAGEMRKPLLLLLAAVATVLLIACANIAGLQLARASGRQKEVSVRIALGAGQRDLVRQALVESGLLAVLGVGLGIALAKAGIPLLLLLAPATLATNLVVSIGGPVFWYIVVAAVVCAVLCGAGPAWQMTHVKWFQALQESGRSETASVARQRMRSALVVVEIGMAMLLLTAAGLLVRSLNAVEQLNMGFDPHGVLSAGLSLPKEVYSTEEKQAAYLSAIENSARSIPGVTHAALIDSIPFTNAGGSSSFDIPGRTKLPNDPGPHGNVRAISPDYFGTMGIPLMRGRVFSAEDRKGTQAVVIIDDVLAKRYWPDQDPLGHQMGFDSDKPWTIVGIVKHARAASLESDSGEGFYFLPVAQQPNLDMGLVVRSEGVRPESLRTALERAVHAVDPNQPLYDVKTMDERVDDSLVSRRFLVVLLSVFAGLALLLAALGLYGVVNYSVRMRTRELGVRMALGARRADVLGLILGQGLRLALVGVAVGLAATFACSHLLESLLYQVKPWNPLTLGGSAALLIGVVLAASFLPARRAASLDPMKTIREQ
jgi:predicted permease